MPSSDKRSKSGAPDAGMLLPNNRRNNLMFDNSVKLNILYETRGGQPHFTSSGQLKKAKLG